MSDTILLGDTLQDCVAAGMELTTPDLDPTPAQTIATAEAEAGRFGHAKCWLDRIAAGSSDQTNKLGERLKDRILETIFPHLARGFLADRKQRLGIYSSPGEEDLRDTFEATLTLLYRLLFLLYAESRDLLPVREAPYYGASLRKISQEIAERAGSTAGDAGERIAQAHSAQDTTLYDRLSRLFAVVDHGDRALHMPAYNGRLFLTDPQAGNCADGARERELRIARFLCDHKVPDLPLALAIDLLSRDEDERTSSLEFIDYRSLAVRHLGSIYEGLLEFKLTIAAEDLTTQTAKGKPKYIALGSAKKKRGNGLEVVVRSGDVYLSNDRAERKASGSYYTPDAIVAYIVKHTVGPVLEEKLETLRPRFREVRKTYDSEVRKATIDPVQKPGCSRKPGFSPDHDSREFALEQVHAANKDRVEDLFEFRVLDPAMGSGYFLVAAVDFITDRLLTFLNEFPINPVTVMLERARRNIVAALGEQGVAVDPATLTDVNLLKRHVLKHCIYGVDLDPLAVDLAKVSLWLDALVLGEPLSFLDDHLRCGNSLIGATLAEVNVPRRQGFQESLPKGHRRFVADTEGIGARPELEPFHWEIEFPEVYSGFADADQAQLKHKAAIAAKSAGFDAVVGNPPYAGHKGDFDAQHLRALYDVCRDYPNPATAFIERGFQLLRQNGRLGLIVPKSIQYVESWAASRRLLAESNHLIGIADVSQAFHDVLLEQTVCLAAKQAPVDGYRAETLARDGAFSGGRIERSVAESLGCFPARVDQRSLELLARVLATGPRLSEIAYTSQALGYQAHLNKDVTGSRVPVHRGKQVRPMRIDAPTDFIDRSFLTRCGTDDLTAKVRQMLRPKVVSQNIVAHILQPKPRVWIISAPDHEGVLCLNTISTTIIHDDRFPIEFVAAVLNSTLAAWFYTEFVFCRAIRTMHFDNYYAGKLPIALVGASRRERFERLTRRIDTQTSRGARQRMIDKAVFDAYGLSRVERRLLYESCYGAENIEAVLAGF